MLFKLLFINLNSSVTLATNQAHHSHMWRLATILNTRNYRTCPSSEMFYWTECSERSKRISIGDFPSGPKAKTPYSQFKGPGFNPWSGN